MANRINNLPLPDPMLFLNLHALQIVGANGAADAEPQRAPAQEIANRINALAPRPNQRMGLVPLDFAQHPMGDVDNAVVPQQAQPMHGDRNALRVQAREINTLFEDLNWAHGQSFQDGDLAPLNQAIARFQAIRINVDRASGIVCSIVRTFIHTVLIQTILEIDHQIVATNDQDRQVVLGIESTQYQGIVLRLHAAWIGHGFNELRRHARQNPEAADHWITAARTAFGIFEQKVDAVGFHGRQGVPEGDLLTMHTMRNFVQDFTRQLIPQQRSPNRRAARGGALFNEAVRGALNFANPPAQVVPAGRAGEPGPAARRGNQRNTRQPGLGRLN